jgi:ATP-dependent Lhr-like helicase
LVELACVARAMREGWVEATRVPTGALDVLAQQMIAMAALDEWRTADLLAMLRRSWCYRDLTERQLNLVLSMLAGDYPTDAVRELKPRIVWDKAAGTIRGRENARAVAVLSGGTIPDRGYYAICVSGSNARIGEMDEEFVNEARPGEVFLLGTASWRIEAIERDRLLVSPAFSATPKMPFWKGEGLGRPYELGLRVGALLREVGDRLDDERLPGWLMAECALDSRAAANLINYLRDERDAIGTLPNDRRIIIETFPDELGDQRIVILSPFGGRVHMAWRAVLARRIRELRGIEAEIIENDDGIMIRVPAGDQTLPLEELLRVTPERARDIIAEEVGHSPLFGVCFRRNAGRALVLPRPRHRQPFWLQRLRAADLLQTTRKYADFPVIVETYREVLTDILDVPGLTDVLTRITDGEVAVETVTPVIPSPFAASLQLGFVAAFMYEGEAPRAERRGALLGVSRDLLREVLGDEQLRGLLDQRAIQAVDDRLQRRDPEWRPRSADETEEMLRQLGDLAGAELTERGVAP